MAQKKIYTGKYQSLDSDKQVVNYYHDGHAYLIAAYSGLLTKEDGRRSFMGLTPKEPDLSVSDVVVIDLSTSEVVTEGGFEIKDKNGKLMKGNELVSALSKMDWWKFIEATSNSNDFKYNYDGFEDDVCLDSTNIAKQYEMGVEPFHGGDNIRLAETDEFNENIQKSGVAANVAETKQEMLYELAKCNTYNDRYLGTFLEWNIKLDKLNLSNPPTHEILTTEEMAEWEQTSDVWETYIERNPSIVTFAMSDALLYYLDGEFDAGLEHVQLAFAQSGRNGGHLLLTRLNNKTKLEIRGQNPEDIISAFQFFDDKAIAQLYHVTKVLDSNLSHENKMQVVEDCVATQRLEMMRAGEWSDIVLSVRKGMEQSL